MKPPRAFLSADGATVFMKRGEWSETFPVESLSSRVDFYTGLMKRKGGAYAAVYEPCVRVLEHIQQKLDEVTA